TGDGQRDGAARDPGARGDGARGRGERVTSEPETPPEENGSERMLRDMEHWKDRVEVSLDNRQVFFLFFGGALVACLIFVLGVMGGKRREARAGEQAVPVKSDPLAALDQVEGEADEPPAPSARKLAAGPSVAPAMSPAPTPSVALEKMASPPLPPLRPER